MSATAKPSRLAIALLVANLIVGNVATTLAQVEGCLPSGFPGQTVGYLGGDGKRHIRIAAPGSIDEVFWAVEKAKNAWNAKSGTTGVVFEFGHPADLTFESTTDPAHHGGCIAQNDPEQKVYYNPGVCNLVAQADNDSMGRAFSHEMGHFLGMRHSDDSNSVMKTCGPGESCDQCLMNRPALTDTDAQRADACLSQSPAVLEGGSYEENEHDLIQEDEQWYDCTFTYLILVYYTCSGGSCSYSHSEAYLIDLHCVLLD